MRPVWVTHSKAAAKQVCPRSAGGHALPGPAATRRWGWSRLGAELLLSPAAGRGGTEAGAPGGRLKHTAVAPQASWLEGHVAPGPHKGFLWPATSPSPPRALPLFRPLTPRPPGPVPCTCVPPPAHLAPSLCS